MAGFRALNMASVVSDQGEVLPPGRMVFVPTKARNGFGKEWFAMATDAMTRLATSDLQGSDLRVFMLLIGQLDWDNFIQVNARELAEKLDMKPTHFSRSLRRLIERDIVREGPKVGSHKTYRMSPETAWRGKPKAHVVALDEWRASRQQAD